MKITFQWIVLFNLSLLAPLAMSQDNTATKARRVSSGLVTLYDFNSPTGNDISINGTGNDNRFSFERALPMAIFSQSYRTIDVTVPIDLTVDHEMTVAK